MNVGVCLYMRKSKEFDMNKRVRAIQVACGSPEIHKITKCQAQTALKNYCSANRDFVD